MSPPKAVDDAEGIVAGLAALEAVSYEVVGQGGTQEVCRFCEALVGWSGHKSDCVWVRARRWKKNCNAV